MKLSHKKNLAILIICLVILGCVFFYYYQAKSIEPNAEQINTNTKNITQTNSNSLDSTSNLNKEEITDIFDANLGSDVKENNSINEPGHRFTVDIIKPQKRVQKGNAKGIVVINDLANKFNHLSNKGNVITNYRFYTKYDAKNNWYTLIKSEINYSSLTGGGDQ